MAIVSVNLNFALGIFNLLPIPPLDGSKVIESMLPLRLMRKYEELSRYGFLILMALLLLGGLSYLSAPIYALTRLSLNLMATLFQLPRLPI
jgi:Zn-dependent protease